MDSFLIIGYCGISIMLALLFVGIPIAFCLMLIGICGLFYVAGISQGMQQITMVVWEEGTNFVLVCIPFFVFMGQLIFHTGIASNLYDSLHKWFGHLPGGLAIATTFGCAGFGAVTGSSVAAAATMGSLCLPEMKRYGYDNKLATGCVAAAGTLAILIPPSNMFVLYGILTDVSIGALFIAGIVPGIITAIIWGTLIYIRCKINPSLGQPGPKFSIRQKIIGTKTVFPVVIIFLVVVGGMYGGIFTPTEAAGIGSFGAFFVSYFLKKLTKDALMASFLDTGRISAMIFAVLVGGYLIARFLLITGVTEHLIQKVANARMHPVIFIIYLIPFYLVLGCILDAIAMVVLTIPIVFPIIVALGIDPVWFGVFLVVMVEIGLVTPPIGMNVFVVRTIAPEVEIKDIFKGVIPFVICELFLIGLLITFPQIALWLVGTIG